MITIFKRRPQPNSVARQSQVQEAEPFAEWFHRLNPPQRVDDYNETIAALLNLRKQLNEAKKEGLI